VFDGGLSRDTYNFNPAIAGVGVHTITYTYSDGNGCTNIATDDIEVFALPIVTFTALADLCIDAGDQAGLGGGSPTGGVYSGPGLTDDGNGMTYSFDPAAAGVGTHTLTYDFTDANGCSGSASDDVEVFDLPTVTFTIPADLCINAGVQAGLGSGTPTGGIYSGPGVTDDGNGSTYSFDPVAAGAGVHTISYTFTDGNSCTNTATDDLEVYPSFTAGAIETTGETICYNGDPATIGNSTLASGGDGTITYQWESSTDGFATAGTVIGGATSSTYDPPSGLLATTSYRRYAHDGTCNTAFEVSTGTWIVNVQELPVANAGSDASIVEGETYFFTDASAENYNAISWSTAGDGEFDSEIEINPSYTPGVNDIAVGSVVLTLSLEGLNPCVGDNDQMMLTIFRPPTVEITFPFEGDVFYDYAITAEGIAADPDNDLTEVYVNLNGGGWELATGTDAWTKDLTLAIGENHIQAKSVDAQGLESEIAEVNVLLSLQVVPLTQGWSIISSHLTPNNPALELIMADVGIPANLTIMLGLQGIYWPEYSINSIGDWNVFEGYKVKHQQADELIIRGDKLANNNMTFSEGFHVIPVLSNVPAQISQIFADPSNDIRYIFDLTSGLAYWPQGGILTLSELLPGRGYLASFNKEVTIDFPDYQNLKTGFTPTTLIAQNHSPWDYSRSANVHQISIESYAAETMKDVSHVGAFDATGRCVGSTEINFSNGNYLLTVFGNDETTSAKDGAVEEELLTFKAYNPQQNLEFEIQPEFSNKMPDVNGEFKTNGMSMITGFKETSTGIGGTSIAALLVELYPNPARDQVTLIYPNYVDDAQSEAEFVNASGKVTKKVQLSGKSTKLDLSDMNPGVYFVKITSESGTVIEKLVIQ